MKYSAMIAELIELKARVATMEAWQKTPLAEQKFNIERDIEVIEIEASIDINNIVDLCEEKTGKPFQFKIKSGQPATQSRTVANFAKEKKLKQMVKILAQKASERYGWSKCKFKEWAEPLFDTEWDRVRKG